MPPHCPHSANGLPELCVRRLADDELLESPADAALGSARLPNAGDASMLQTASSCSNATSCLVMASWLTLELSYVVEIESISSMDGVRPRLYCGCSGMHNLVPDSGSNTVLVEWRMYQTE